MTARPTAAAAGAAGQDDEVWCFDEDDLTVKPISPAMAARFGRCFPSLWGPRRLAVRNGRDYIEGEIERLQAALARLYAAAAGEGLGDEQR